MIPRQPVPSAAPSAEAPADGKKPAPANPLEALQAKRRADLERAAADAEARQRIKQLQDRVAELEKRLSQLRNPLLGRARPQGEEAEAWKGADQAERLRLTEQRLAAARKELAKAQRDSSGVR